MTNSQFFIRFKSRVAKWWFVGGGGRRVRILTETQRRGSKSSPKLLTCQIANSLRPIDCTALQLLLAKLKLDRFQIEVRLVGHCTVRKSDTNQLISKSKKKSFDANPSLKIRCFGISCYISNKTNLNTTKTVG